MKRYRAVRLLSVVTSIACALLMQLASAQDLRPFTARYQARFYGLSGGVLALTLRKGTQPNEYVYESKAEPSFLGSFAISDKAREASTMIIDANGIRPLSFFSDDGKRGDEKDSNLQFNWEQKKLTGRSETVDMNAELPPRIQDHMSIQVAVIYALQNNLPLGEYPLVDGGEIKRYLYTNEGPATIKYKGRQLETAIIRSERIDSPGGRIIRYWHSAEFGNIPVKAERSRNGKIDFTMDLLDVKFAE